MTVGEWYVDLRVDKQTGNLDWAIAGQCLEKGQNPRCLVFTHEIDSNRKFNISNPCPFIPQPNGDELETGTMARPDKPGTPMADYEEVWRYLPIRKSPEGRRKGVAWVLESDDGDLDEGQYNITKVFMGRIGGTYLVLQQDQTHVRSRKFGGEWAVKITGGDVSSRLEEWVDDRWVTKYALGPKSDSLPSMTKGIKGNGQGLWRVPEKRVLAYGHPYVVRAFDDLGSRDNNGVADLRRVSKL
ncbi:hypothetical protein PHISCL_08540 [Aspergillus sclerotialis]|uniref:Uncharacterized protein n=1 Tax=Aspergillus sclerotialis TaxID=2070753 RepID=A0A3A2Z895_9EURO|nr:hypothetical protein PHISCL_08540 [Aspergillus sclerotialis]